MRMRRFSALVVGLMLSLTSRVGAQAPAPAPVDEATRAHAREIFQQGVASMDAGNCPEAVARFREAYELVHEPSILYNLATTEGECHDPLEARAHYREFLAQVRSGSAARYRPDARRQVTAIERTLGRLGIIITGVEEDDEVRVGDRVVQFDELAEVWVMPGAHHIEVHRGGRIWGTADVEVAAGRRAVIQVTLTEPPPLPPPSEVAANAEIDSEPERDALGPSQRVRRRRIIIGSSVAAAVVTSIVVAVSVSVTR